MQSVRLFVANLRGSLSFKCGCFVFWLAIFCFTSILPQAFAQSTNAPINPYDAGEISFTTSTFNAAEADGKAIITLTRTGQWGIVYVDVIVTDGTATNKVNYTSAVTNTIVFSNLQTQASFPIAIIPDGKTNKSGTFVSANLSLTNARPATNQFLTVTPKISKQNATAKLNILDQDGLFKFNIEKSWYEVQELGFALVNVVLKAPPGDGAQDVSVDYEVTTDAPARAGSDLADIFDYETQTGTLTFGPNDTNQSIVIAITQDNAIEFNEDFHVLLKAAHGSVSPPADPNATNTPPDQMFSLGPVSRATVTILFNGSPSVPQPAGAVDVTWNADRDPTTVPAFNINPGANNTVAAISTMSDGRTYIGGEFTSVDALSRNRIARLQTNGVVDPTFAPPGGANRFVTAVAAYNSGPNKGKVLIGGGFTAVNGTQKNSIARLNEDGSVDNSFNIGNGANGPIYSIALQLDNSILIAGDFSSFDGILVDHVARLLPNGQLDLNYQTGVGPNGPVYSIISQSAPKVVVHGGRTNGITDMFTQTVNVGANSGVISLNFTFQETNDFTIVYGGQPIYFSGLIDHLFVLTNQDGTLTNVFGSTVTNIPFSGADGNLTFIVNSLTNAASNWTFTASIQPNRVLGAYIGGDFTQIAGTDVGHVARLGLNGVLDTTFVDGTGIGADNTVYALGTQTNGQIIVAGAFKTFNSYDSAGLARLNLDGTIDSKFTVGVGTDDTIKSVAVDPQNRILIGGAFHFYNYSRRLFLARLLPNGPLDTTFMDPAFNQFAGFPGQNGDFPNGGLESVALDAKDGVIVGGRFSQVGGGQTRMDIHPRVNFARLHGDNRRASTRGPGNISFLAGNYGADENSGSLGMLVGRTNGNLGAVGVFLDFVDGAATDKLDYTNKPLLVLFGDGVSVDLPVQVPIIDDQLIEGNEDFTGMLSFPIGALVLGGEFIPTAPGLGEISEAQGIILDDDVQASTVFFSQNEYDFNENDGTVTIDVYRGGNSSLAGTVRYSTSALSEPNAATPGQDFTSATGSINFASGQTNKTFTLKLTDDQNVEPDESFAVSLVNPSSGINIASNNVARVNIIDNDYAPGRVSFTATNYTVVEGGVATLTVRRAGGNVGLLQVHYTTLDGTATAPIDYQEQSGTLTWNNQESGPKTIQIPVSENGLVQGTRNFSLVLSDVTPSGGLGIRTNAIVTISDNDALGSFSFNAKEFLADENGTNVIINVIRRGGSSEVATVQYSTVTNSAVAGQDYVATSGTLTFGIGETSKSFSVTILDNTNANPEKVIGLALSNALPSGALLGPITNSTIAIIDNESLNIPAGSVETDYNTDTGANNSVQAIALQSDGKLILGGDFQVVNRQVRTYLARVDENGVLDSKFGQNFSINDSVRAIEIQGDSRILIGGTFTNIDGLPVNHVARLSSAGIRDSTFDIGSGADGAVFAIKAVNVNSERKVLIAGAFSVYNGEGRRGIARVNDNGQNDSTFNPGSGVNGNIYAMVVQTDGRIIIGGEFSTINGVPRINIARLNQDGSLDNSFDSGLGVDGPVRSLLIQYDDKIILGGVFENVSGVPRKNIARINFDGTVDSTFHPGSGANGPVYALGLQLDGKVIAAGDFTVYNGQAENRIIRLNADGSNDTSINFGTGANGFIAAVAIQSDRKIVIGGGFSEVDSQPRNRFARIYGGSIQGPGELMFASPLYNAGESATNAVITVRRYGGLAGTVSANYFTQGTTASPGADYQNVSGNLSFGPGENFKTFVVPVIDDALPEDREEVTLALTNAVGSLPLLRQPVATLAIQSDDTIIEFRDVAYNFGEAAPGGRAVIFITRRGESTVAQSVTFSTENGTAIAGQDYEATSTTVVFNPGETSKAVAVNIIDDTQVEESETVTLHLNTNIGRSTATLTIFDNDFAPGILSIVQPPAVNENAGSVSIAVTRASGKSGAVSVQYTVSNNTATGGSDYTPVSGTLNFQEGEIAKPITVQLLDDNSVEGNESFVVQISAPGGGAILGTDTALVTILDDDFGPGSLDTTFNTAGGASGPVRAMEIQPDGKILLGGDFDVFAGNQVNDITRLNPNGSVDTDFSTAGGSDGAVFTLAQQINGKIGFGGSFTSLGSVTRPYLAQTLTNGFPDVTFIKSASENGNVLSIAAQPDGKYVVGGEFTTPAAHVMRVNSDGSLDVSFNPDFGTDGNVNRLEVQADGRVLVGGNFTKVGNFNVRSFARLMPNGLLDASFNIGSGVAGTVNAITIAPDGKILIGGAFTSVNGTSRSRLARINSDGTVDLSFVPAVPNGPINDIITYKGKIYIGGSFTTVGSSNRVNVARLNFDGSLDTEFDPGIGPDAAVNALAVQSDGSLLIAGAFQNVNGLFTPGIARLNGAISGLSGETRFNSIRTESGEIVMNASTDVGQTYRLEGTSDFKIWDTVQTKVASSTSTEFRAPISDTHKFYRIKVNP
jgi:uncharacterized delta-60 repeat protein